MTTINPALGSISTATKDTSNSDTSKKMSALLDEMTGTDSVQKATPAAAQTSYLLDLSPQAQAYLGQKNAAASSASDDSFILSDAQRKQISDIIAKYKDEPFTKETYDKIEAELDLIGLSPSTLAIKDHARTINPTMMLLDALNGTNASLNSALTGMQSSQASSDQKKDNYVKSLLDEWSGISTTIGEEDSET